MRNIKDQVYSALTAMFGEDAVTDQYPQSWADLPAIQYTEEDNKVLERTDEGETKSYVRYRIDIFHNRSTSAAALEVEQALGYPMEGQRGDVDPLGLSRTMCQDTPDPSGMKHKVMRYEGIIDMENDCVYWPG